VLIQQFCTDEDFSMFDSQVEQDDDYDDSAMDGLRRFAHYYTAYVVHWYLVDFSLLFFHAQLYFTPWRRF
jgi:hypothetical protein